TTNRRYAQLSSTKGGNCRKGCDQVPTTEALVQRNRTHGPGGVLDVCQRPSSSRRREPDNGSFDELYPSGCVEDEARSVGSCVIVPAGPDRSIVRNIWPRLRRRCVKARAE